MQLIAAAQERVRRKRGRRAGQRAGRGDGDVRRLLRRRCLQPGHDRWRRSPARGGQWRRRQEQAAPAHRGGGAAYVENDAVTCIQ